MAMNPDTQENCSSPFVWTILGYVVRSRLLGLVYLDRFI